MKILIAAILTSLVLGGAGANMTDHSPALSGAGGGRSPVMAVCVAGLQLAVGGEKPVRLAMSDSGRCDCPVACSAASLSLRIAGLTVRL